LRIFFVKIAFFKKNIISLLFKNTMRMLFLAEHQKVRSSNVLKLFFETEKNNW